MLKKIFILSILCLFVFLLTHIAPGEAKGNMNEGKANAQLTLNTSISAMNQSFLIEKKINFLEKKQISVHIIDRYGILNMPHRYAVKFVKYPGAIGRMETYEKKGDEYIMRHTYTADYPKEGPKENPWDLKTVGGNVVRYLYRTTKSGMNGWNKESESFGVYKVSFPMPHDLEPLLEAKKITKAQYDKIPAINYKGIGENKMLYPHPKSAVGADIVLHTARKGSRGCIMIENEAMSRMYHEDLVTENDKELIPLIIYDEDVIAPPIGQLF